MFTKKSNLNLAQLPVVKTALGKTVNPYDNSTQCTEPFCNREKLFRCDTELSMVVIFYNTELSLVTNIEY